MTSKSSINVPVQEEPSLKKLIIKNTFWVYLFIYVGIPIGYLIRIIYSRTLSVEDYGLFYSIIGFLAILSTFNDLGFSETLNYFGIRFYEQKKYSDLKSSFIYAILMQLSTALLICFLLFFLAPWLATHYFHSTNSINLLRLLLIYFLFANLIITLVNFFKVKQDLFKNSLIGFLRLPLILLFSLGIFFFSNKLLVISLSWTMAYIFMVIVSLILIKKDFSFLKKIKFKWDFKLYKKLFSYSSMVLLGTGASILFTGLDIQVITFFRNLSEVALYSNAYAISNSLMLLITPISIVMFPLTSKLFANKEFLKIDYLVTIIYKLLFVLGSPIFLLFISFPKEILLLLFGSKYVPAANTLVILAIGFFFLVLANLNLTILAARGEVKPRVKIMYALTLLNIIIDVLLVPSIGYMGAAIGTTICLILMFFMSYRITKNKPKITLDFLIKTIFLNIVFFFTVLLLKKWLLMSIILKATIIGLISFSLYFLIAYYLKLYDLKIFKKIFLERKI